MAGRGQIPPPPHCVRALEVYLANMAAPDDCGTTWLENNPDFLDPDRVPTNTPFTIMDADDEDEDSLENWLGQPVLPWSYDPGEAREGAVVVRAEDMAALLGVKPSAATGATEPATVTEAINPAVSGCTLKPIPVNEDDFGEPTLEDILVIGESLD